MNESPRFEPIRTDRRVTPRDQEALLEASEAIAGRNQDSSRFRRTAAVLLLLVLFIPVLLISWSTFGGSGDRMVRAQWTWAIILAVAGLGLLLRTARLGTDITWDGVRRHRLLGSDDIPWTAVRGFTTSWQGRSGVWMVTDPTGWGGNLPPEVRRVPSDQHVWDAEAAATAVDRLNRALGVDRPVGPPGAGAYERIGAWTWFLPLASVGLASVPVLLAVAVAGRRMWHWLAAVAAVDLVVVEMAGLSDTGAPQAMVALLVLGIWLGAGAVPLVAWLATRRSRLAGVRS